jgi:PilZ domain-containing protein
LVDRRQMTRYDFGAIAEVVDLDSRDDMIVVTRDLSLSGCFVKTRTPVPAGTEVRVRITYAGSDFAAIGSVTSNITREGMGIEFVEVEPEDQAIVEGWLGISARAADGQNGIRLKNRLSRQELPRVISAEPKPKSDPLTLADNEVPDLPRNLVNFRNDRPQ